MRLPLMEVRLPPGHWGVRRHPLPLRQRTCGLVSGTMGAARPQYAQAMCLCSSDPVVWGEIACIMMSTYDYADWDDTQWQAFSLGQLFREDEDGLYTLVDARKHH